MGPAALAQVLRPLAALFPPERHPDLLVGLADPDDAAVYRLAADDALVFTTDFFPPVVDDPYDFGAIAAANAMSDVFAMGGEVVMALNLAVFPDSLPAEVLEAIVRGGADTVAAAGGALAGGHTVAGAEPMYGLAVVGRVDPAHMLRKDGARPGDRLLLTKPIGTGLVTTALKAGTAAQADVAAATQAMRALNRAAGRAAVAAGARAATDVTGYGLVGHAAEMASQAGVCLVFDVARLPLLPGALACARAGAVPGGTARNRAGFGAAVIGMSAVPEPWVDIVFDPQTSGGLLVALAPAAARAFEAALTAAGGTAVEVGYVRDGHGVELTWGGAAPDP
jgi:selenide, water dikinase